MPVPTDTFRNIKLLNIIFAASGVLMLLSTFWLIHADYNRKWRQYQREALVWETAITKDAQAQAEDDQTRDQISQLNEQMEALLSDEKSREAIARLEGKIAEAQAKRDAKVLPAAKAKGELTPKQQLVEKALLTYGEGSDQVQQERRELAAFKDDYEGRANELALLDQQIANDSNELTALQAEMTETDRQLADLQRQTHQLAEKLAKVNPTGGAWVGNQLRNAPLLDWFNPSQKVQQVVVPSIRTNLNFLTVDSIDRCHTCHVNIASPLYEESTLLTFTERQVARYKGQKVDSLKSGPVVLLDFWENAAEERAKEDHVLRVAITQTKAQARERINQLRAQNSHGKLNESANWVDEIEDHIALTADGDDAAQSYRPVSDYLDDLRQALRQSIGDDAFKQLFSLYRHRLIDHFNRQRAESGLKPVSADLVMLGHPNPQLYAGADSKHPMKSVGCTACHEGSGEETQFEHTAHTPRDIWVDARSGAPVPAFLTKSFGDLADLKRQLRRSTGTVASTPTPGSSPTPRTGWSVDGASVAFASDTEAAAKKHSAPQNTSGHDTRHGHDTGHRYVHHDLNLNDRDKPGPLSPSHHDQGNAALYMDPTDQTLRLAIRQADYWVSKYGWHAVKYMYWEKPMHAQEYIESSCTKCHQEVYDVKDAAPQLFQGRLLFSKLGCVNCHAVGALEDDLDIKRVGPSLVQVKHKLSRQMIASWIWSPRAFRPTTRMPHYFMLENNSSPADVLRTRVEVAAMTDYLKTAEPDTSYYEGLGLTVPSYEPETAPKDPGDEINGRVLFNQIGCLACHTNLAEHGQRWIVEDIEARKNVSKSEATTRYENMTYNQRHQYAQLHLADRLELTGPELSGVATKLLAGRSPEDARRWLYDWIRNPRHYSSYTIMPSFRLSEQEANDLAAYLLTLERPGYTPHTFDLDEAGREMLKELVATLKAPQSTINIARDDLKVRKAELVKELGNEQAGSAQWIAEQMQFLGQKMISHYGCNGCHLINGVEQAASACTNLDGWGLKDPHKIDFAYYGHAFERQRRDDFPLWRVKHEGLNANAPQITHVSDQFEHEAFTWEHIGDDRRSWLYYKLHNPRTYDRGKFPVTRHQEAPPQEASPPDSPDTPASSAFSELAIQTEIQQGRPYDKLKMPKFFLTDDQVQALVTFVTSIRKPLVSAAAQNVVDDAGERIIRGRQVATRYNCYGCHNIEGNQPQIRQFFDTKPNGSFNDQGYKWAPPRLIGEGAKVQHDWLFDFLQNVHRIRPWLVARMPSFPMTEDDATTLVGYFAGHSQLLARDLAEWLTPIDEFIARAPAVPGAGWYEAESLSTPLTKIKQFAILAELVKAEDLDPRTKSPEERATTWNDLRSKLHVLAAAYHTNYPFVPSPRVTMSPAEFKRGENFIQQLGCMAGQCHSQGDEQLVARLAALDAAALAEEEEEDEEEGYGEEDYGDDEDAEEDNDEAEEEEDDDYEYGEDEDEEGADLAEIMKFASAPAGDPAVGAKTPNLIRVGERIQRRWLNHWVQHPTTIQPGTWMFAFFLDGKSQFAAVPGALRGQMESLYGYTSDQQRDLLMDYLFAASARNHTHTLHRPERLTGQAQAEIEIPTFERPADTVAKVEGTTEETAALPETGEPVDVKPAAEPPKPIEEVATSSIELHDGEATFDSGGTGRVIGEATFAGKPPRRRPQRVGADAYCDAFWKKRGTKLLSESTVVNPDGTVQNVLLHVVGGLPSGKSWEVPKKPVLIDQVGCRYVPHVSAVMAGQTVTVRNSDSTLHNVKLSSKHNGSINKGQYQGVEDPIPLKSPEIGVSFKCDVHPWMGARIHVMAHPFFSVSDVAGRFEIRGLPPGTYTLEAWHESNKIDAVRFDVQVKADTSHRADVQLK